MIKAKINATGEVVEVRPYQTEKSDFMVCRSGGIMGELYMRSELTIIGDNELDFVSLVKKMRKAQKRQEYTDSTLDKEAMYECRKFTKQRESEVDEYLKKKEILKVIDWIKVEDRLPEDGGMQVSDLVLVRIVDDNPRAVSKAYPAIGYCLLDTGEWRSHDDREINPTHWMPIILPNE